MATYCEKHDLVLAADGKCVLCRRERMAGLPVATTKRNATIDTLVTACLGLGLLTAFGLLVWTARLPGAEDGSRYIIKPEARSLPQRSGSHAARPPPADDATPVARVSTVRAAKSITQTQNDPARASLRAARAAVEEAKRSVEITMYSTSWCTICETSRYYLEGRDLKFKERDIELDDRARVEMNKLNRLGSVPTFVIADEVLVGFNPWQLEDMLAKEARKHVSLACQKQACGDGRDEGDGVKSSTSSTAGVP